MDHAAFEAAALERVDFSGRHAAEPRFDQCRLSQVDFTGAELARGLIADAVVTGGSWANVHTIEMRIRRTSFTGVRMTGVDLSWATLDDVAFTDCRIDLGNFWAGKLNRVRFERCRLDEVDFSDAKLTSVEFVDCVLVRSLWTKATLTDCEMRGSDISGAGNPERLKGVRMPWADVLASAAVFATAAGVEIIE